MEEAQPVSPEDTEEPEHGRVWTVEEPEQQGPEQEAPPRWLSLLVESYWLFRIVGTVLFLLSLLYGWLVGCEGCATE